MKTLESSKGKSEPRCWSGKCRNTELHSEGIDAWVNFLMACKYSRVSSADELKRLANAEDDETVEFLIELDFYHENLLEQKREIDRQIARAERG